MNGHPIEPLICPQCGGQVDEANATGGSVRCEYCNTQFHVADQAVPAAPTRPVATPAYLASRSRSSMRGTTPFVVLIIAVVMGVFIYNMIGVQRTFRRSYDDAQSAANDAQSAANALRSMANSMANAARSMNTNSRPPSPTPTPKK